MYEAFYGFSQRPFSLLPDPAFLYLSEKYSTALTLLEYGLTSQAGVTVITGDIGCGKTTLIRYLLGEAAQDVTIGLITNTHAAFGELLQWVLAAFSLDYREPSKVERYQRFVRFIIDEYAHNRRTVLIVDEAQNLTPQTLEELRMLSNINSEKDLVLQLILVGQPALLETLRLPELAQFAQRVAVDYFIEPLEEKDVRGYIRHRLTVAGGKPSLFRPGAFEPIFEYGRGVPRLVNLICDTALVYGYAAQRKTISDDIIMRVVRDKLEGKRLWQRPAVDGRPHPVAGGSER